MLLDGSGLLKERNMSRSRNLVAVVAVSLLWMSAPASADEFEDEPNKPTIYTGYGTSLTVGGGVVGFTDGDMRDFATVGGAWDARVVYGTRQYIAAEAAYTGGAVPVDALGLDDNASLVSTGLEVLGRVNLMKSDWQPYLMAGIGWRHYSVVNTDQNTSSVGDSEDVGEIPMGAGVAYRYRGLVLDARGLFRAAFADEMIASNAGGGDAKLHNWQGQMTVGLEF
jgi:hypothetical protein